METLTFVPETKGRSHGSNSEHKGLQIPKFGTCELQIRWNENEKTYKHDLNLYHHEKVPTCRPSIGGVQRCGDGTARA